jgi:two-component system, OmpR family, response regulator CpxR
MSPSELTPAPDNSEAGPAAHLLIVDDDVKLCKLLTEYLGANGFVVHAVHDGEEGVRGALSGDYGVVILDVMLPPSDGFEVLRRIRAQSAVPVLMLTARGDDVDRIVGLEMGADDYLPKPFNARELLARVHAILRRARGGEATTRAGERLSVGDLELDVAARFVRCGKQRINLTETEALLLEMLLRDAGSVVDRDELARKALGRRFTPLDRSVDMHVSNLRRKLEATPEGADRIKAVRGLGYMYAGPRRWPVGRDTERNTGSG